MKILSSDQECFIELVPDNYDGIQYMEVIAEFGDFGGRNNSVHLENLLEFIGELDRFISDRTATPELRGTYGFTLTFLARSPVAKPHVRCTLGSTYSPSEGDGDFRVYGEFAIEGEYLNQYLADFIELSRPHPDLGLH